MKVLAAIVGLGTAASAFLAWVLSSYGVFMTSGAGVGDRAPAAALATCAAPECGVTVALFGASLATLSPAFGLKAAARPGRAAYDDLYRELAASESVGLIDDAPR